MLSTSHANFSTHASKTGASFLQLSVHFRVASAALRRRPATPGGVVCGHTHMLYVRGHTHTAAENRVCCCQLGGCCTPVCRSTLVAARSLPATPLASSSSSPTPHPPLHSQPSPSITAPSSQSSQSQQGPGAGRVQLASHPCHCPSPLPVAWSWWRLQTMGVSETRTDTLAGTASAAFAMARCPRARRERHAHTCQHTPA